MNRTLARASVWLPALKAIDKLPPCPEHIPEPRYAYVMFCEALCDVSVDGRGITVSLRNVQPGFIIQDCSSMKGGRTMVNMIVTGQILCDICFHNQ